ncbi:3,4-dihydroxy-2-butanone-4-phosphate synthase, partial [Burkholderia pseudomallei]
VERFAAQNGFQMLTIAELVAFRERLASLIERDECCADLA